MKRQRSAWAVAILLACGCAATPKIASAGDWYRWRGPEQNGVSREHGIVSTWSPETGENVLWKNNVGSMSSPIVMNGKIYTISRAGEVAVGGQAGDTVKAGPMTRESYVCCDAKTGKTLWEHYENMTQTDVPFHRIGWSNPVGDPATNRVYFFGCQCWFLCLDGDTGKVIWKRQMTEEFGTISTFGGRTPSPAIDEDQVFVAGISFGWGENARGQHRIFAFNKNTGELNWTAPTGGVPTDAPQNTPVVTVINGERLVIFGGGDGGIHAFQARTGKKVWSEFVSKRGLNASVIVDGTRVYCSFDLENLDNQTLGSVMCFECASGKPVRLWRHDGIEAGFPSGTISEGRLYMLDNSAVVHCLDATTGKALWKKNAGRIGKASLVYVDGKLLVTEANGRFTILKPGDKKADVLSKNEVPEKLGREYATYGTPAISDGKIFLQAANQTFCIGAKDAAATPADPIPPMAAETAPTNQPAVLQVIPADVAAHGGEKVKFSYRAFDANGQAVAGAVEAKWSVGPLMIPPPPPKPGTPRDPNAKPSPVGTLQGEVAPDGTLGTSDKPGPIRGGAVVATAGDLTGFARVRVFPPLPLKFDFEQSPVGKPPLTWTGAGGKFAVSDLDGNKVLEKLIDEKDAPLSLPPKALYARARTNYGAADMHDYMVQADVRVTGDVLTDDTVSPPRLVIRMPDAGVINSRYVLEVQGSTQTANIHVWQYAMPDYTSKSIDFAWKPNTWYRLKLSVTQAGEKAMLKGKVWAAADQEPTKWMIELEDPNPNRRGNPGLWGFSNDNKIYYDNIIVTPNPTPAAAAK